MNSYLRRSEADRRWAKLIGRCGEGLVHPSGKVFSCELEPGHDEEVVLYPGAPPLPWTPCFSSAMANYKTPEERPTPGDLPMTAARFVGYFVLNAAHVGARSLSPVDHWIAVLWKDQEDPKYRAQQSILGLCDQLGAQLAVGEP